METSFSLSEPSSTKKRKLTDDNDYQDELDSMKLKMDEMKEINDTQKDMIYEQAMTIRKLQKEKDNLAKSAATNKNMENKIDRLKNVEEELRSKLVQLEDDKKKSEADMAELKSTVDNQAINFEKQLEAAQETVKELEERLSLAKCVNPGFAADNEDERKALQEKVNESAYDEYAKKIKEMEQLNNNQRKILQDENDQLKTALEETNKKIKDLEAAIESEKMNFADLQFELEQMQQCYKDDLNKNKDLKGEYDKKMAEMKEKFDNNRKICEAEMKGLNSSNADLFKIISEDQKAIARYQNQVEGLNKKITVAKTKETKLHSKLEGIEKKELDARSMIIAYEKQIRDLQSQLKQARQQPTQLAPPAPVITSGTSAVTEAEQKIRIEDQIRRCLMRRPHTTKELLSNIRPQFKNVKKTAIVKKLAELLIVIGPKKFRKKQGKKEILYFSLVKP